MRVDLRRRQGPAARDRELRASSRSSKRWPRTSPCGARSSCCAGTVSRGAARRSTTTPAPERFQARRGELPFAGHHTLDSFSLLQAGQSEYRRWAFESAALDLALKPGGPLARRGDRTTAAATPLRRLDARREVSRTGSSSTRAALQARPRPRLGRRDLDRRSRRRAPSTRSTSRASTAASSARRRTRRCTRASPEAFPEAWLEDPALTPRHHAALAAHRDRITWDAAIHEWSDVEALPFQPRCLNCKPSRFGSVRRLFDFYDACESARDRSVRRRPVRARPGPPADPVARVDLPRRRAERRGALGLQRRRAGRRPAARARSSSRRRSASELGGLRREPRDRPVPRRAERMPRGAAAGLAAADDEVANVEVPVRRLARTLRDLVHVEVERPRRRRMELDLEARLLARLAQRRRLQRGSSRSTCRRAAAAARASRAATRHVRSPSRRSRTPTR